MNKEYILEKKIKQLIDDENKNNPLSDSEISKILEISLQDVRKIREKLKIDNKYNRNISKKENKDIFSDVIGYDKSLKSVIDSLKSSVMYPPKGLNILILGNTGVGKTYLAKKTYEFAKKTSNFSEKSPFYVFNCADYSDNPQLLLSQLFGYAKGSFTGAEKDKKGIVELCDEGILFLDEIHRLPAEGQEMLYLLMDKGLFRRMGEVDSFRKVNLLIIAATTESEKNLLEAFRRRIPLRVNVPNLEERDKLEKRELIDYFFKLESKKLNKYIVVRKEILNYLVNKIYFGNIGQLKTEIQVLCAKSYLDYKLKKRNEIELNFELLNEIENDYNEINFFQEKYLTDIVYYPTKNKIIEKNINFMEDDIYSFVEVKYKKLKSEYKNNDELVEVLNKEFVNILENSYKKYKDLINNYGLLSVLGSDFYELLKNINKIFSNNNYSIKEEMIFPLVIYIKNIYEKNIPFFPKELFKTYKHKKINEDVIELIEQSLKIRISKKYQQSIFKYIENILDKINILNRPFILVALHGNVASEMVKVVNSILNYNYAIPIDVPLYEKYEETKLKIYNLLNKIENKDIIIFNDMGSLLNISYDIKEKIDKNIYIVEKTDTLTLLDCVSKVLYTNDETLKIYNSILKKDDLNDYSKEKENIILCICATGKGNAIIVKNHIEKFEFLKNKKIKILTKGYIDIDNLEKYLSSMSNTYNLISIISSFESRKFIQKTISLNEIFSDAGYKKLYKLITDNYDLDLSDVLKKENIFYLEKRDKEEILDYMSNHLFVNKYVNNEFQLGIYKREALYPTYLNGNIALPHSTNDSILKSTISIAILKNPVLWDDKNFVDIVIMIALKDEDQKYFEKFYKKVIISKKIEKLRKIKNSEKVLNIVLE